MGKYVYLNKEIDKEILIDWYINSTDEDAIWTEKHIDELLEDFVLVPKSSLKAIEEKTINDIKKQSVKHGRWLPSDSYITTAYGTIHCQICSECGANLMEDDDYDYDFCPVCGARMDGDAE